MSEQEQETGDNAAYDKATVDEPATKTAASYSGELVTRLYQILLVAGVVGLLLQFLPFLHLGGLIGLVWLGTVGYTIFQWKTKADSYEPLALSHLRMISLISLALFGISIVAGFVIGTIVPKMVWLLSVILSLIYLYTLYSAFTMWQKGEEVTDEKIKACLKKPSLPKRA